MPLFSQLVADTKGNWGVMNAQQTVEHLADAVKNASGKLLLPSLTQGEQLEKMRTFLMSDKPFRENTPNPMMPSEGAALRRPDMKSAVEKLQSELDYFFDVFKKQSGAGFFDNAISDFGDFQMRGNRGRHPLQLTLLFKLRHEVAQIVVGHGVFGQQSYF